MSETAAYYHAHKDDPNLWGDEESSPVPKGTKLDTSVTVRFPPDIAKELLAASAKEGMSLSQFVRAAVWDAVQFKTLYWDYVPPEPTRTVAMKVKTKLVGRRPLPRYESDAAE